MNPTSADQPVLLPDTQSLAQPATEILPLPVDPPKPQPRLSCADRQMILPPMPLDDLLTPDHHARAIWEFVEGLDLTVILKTIRSVEGGPGRPAIDPKILVALWLLATVEGI